MKKVRVAVIKDTIAESKTGKPCYKPDLTVGVHYKEGDKLIHPISVHLTGKDKGKPKVAEIEVTILEKGIDF